MAEDQINEHLSAPEILLTAADIIDQRSKLSDQENGERSMAHTVAMFNAKYNTDMTEAQGWYFMICLKNARMEAGGFCADDYTDAVAYEALHAECMINEHRKSINRQATRDRLVSAMDKFVAHVRTHQPSI